MNISRENETNNIESELKRRIKQWAEQEGLEVPKDFEQIAELTKIKYSVKPKNWKKNEGTFECYTEDNKKVLVTLLNRNICDGFSRICITEGYVTKIYLVQKDQKLGVSVSLEEKIIKRCIHTSADFEYLDILKISETAVQKIIDALNNKCTIYTDTNIVKLVFN